MLAVVLPDFVDAADEGMVESCGRLGFAEKALAGGLVAFQELGKELDGNLAVERRVLGKENLAHPALAELVDNAVVREGPPDHLFPPEV